jgi:hypothetical protein
MDTLSDLAPQLRPGDALFKADVQDVYYHLRLRRCDRDKLLFPIAGRWFLPLALNCGPVTRAMVVYNDPPTCCPRTATTGTPRHFVLGRTLRSATYRQWGYSGKLGRCRTGGQGNSRTVCGTLVEAIPHQNRFPGEARFGVARYCGGHPTAAPPPVPFEACQDLPSGQTVPPEGHLTQEKMFPSRYSAILWTWKFCVPCDYRRPPAPAGPLRLCKRRDLKLASAVLPPKPSRLGLVRRPSHQRARGWRNLGRFPICDPRHGRLDRGLGGRAARSTNEEREHPERRGPPDRGRLTPEF